MNENTKYLKWYYDIIFKAKLENRKKSQGVYYESHHIFPKSLFPEYGSLRLYGWNQVLLTAKEHFICHFILMKHFKKTGDKNGFIKMGLAFNRMSLWDNKTQTRKVHNSTMFEILVSNKSEITKLIHTGKVVSKETREKHSEWMKKHNPMKNIETRNKMIRTLRLREVTKGSNNGFFEKSHSSKTKKILSEKAKKLGLGSKKVTCPYCGISGGSGGMNRNHFKYCEKNPHKIEKPTQKMKIRECPHCGKVGSGGNMTRYHFDNCKEKR
jgi:endogenous inhibitor of DNA gyrase (YacG/DUF329 family)